MRMTNYRLFRADNVREPVKFDKRLINIFDYADYIIVHARTLNIENRSYLLYNLLFFFSSISLDVMCYKTIDEIDIKYPRI